jgi:hypothetical protein
VKKIYAALVMVIVAAIALAVIAGCGGTSTTSSTTGGSNPQTAVTNFLKGISEMNWDLYSGSILPENLKALKASDLAALKKQFTTGTTKTSFSGLTMKTDVNPKDKTQATVTMTGGTITSSAGATSAPTVQNVVDMPMASRTIYTRQYKGKWYIDMAAMSQLQQQQQQQSTTPSTTPATP